MISPENVTLIGRLLKPHGISGEITLVLNQGTFCDRETPYYFLEIDGVFVPFFIEELHIINDTLVHVKFEDVDGIASAAKFTNLFVYLPRERVKNTGEQDEGVWNFFVGYTMVDETVGKLGTIEEVDDSTLNVLFHVKQNDREYLIPASQDFFIEIDELKKTLYVDLPHGLIEE